MSGGWNRVELVGLGGFCCCGVCHLRENLSERKKARLNFERHAVGGRFLAFDDCETASELGGILKGFAGADIDGYESQGRHNTKADRNIDIIRGTRTPPSKNRMKLYSAFGMVV